MKIRALVQVTPTGKVGDVFDNVAIDTASGTAWVMSETGFGFRLAKHEFEVVKDEPTHDNCRGCNAGIPLGDDMCDDCRRVEAAVEAPAAQVTLELRVRVTYELGDTRKSDLKLVLSEAATHLASNGLLSGGLDAAVAEWSASVLEGSDGD